jgi:signal transduction histidine kinase
VSNALVHGSDPVIVDLHDLGASVAIDVTNRGELPSDDTRLFEPFATKARERQGHLARRRGPGLGLGLYIVKQIARAHGGGIAATTPGEGWVRFRLSLPRRVSLAA